MSNPSLSIRLVRLRAQAALPGYQTPGSVGMDLQACMISEDASVYLLPGEILPIPTGIAIEIPEGFEAQVRSRSGLSLQGITVANAPGTIDQDYRGEIKVLLENRSKSGFMVKHRQRIAQLVIAPVQRTQWDVVDSLDATVRGVAGFGSTGE